MDLSHTIFSPSWPEFVVKKLSLEPTWLKEASVLEVRARDGQDSEDNVACREPLVPARLELAILQVMHTQRVVCASFRRSLCRES